MTEASAGGIDSEKRIRGQRENQAAGLVIGYGNYERIHNIWYAIHNLIYNI